MQGQGTLDRKEQLRPGKKLYQFKMARPYMKPSAGDSKMPESVLREMSTAIGYEITEPPEDAAEREKLKDRVTAVIGEYASHLKERTSHHLGYPYNLDFDFAELDQVQKFSVNNLGDPFVESNYGVHSRKFEIGVLEWFAKVWEIPVDEMWGYVTNCGTEGNLHGVLTGREVLPTGVLYCSKATHYSVPKAGRMYRMPLCLVNANDNGEIDLDHLRTCLAGGKAMKLPAIINVNIGTTVKGAVDDLDGILRVLEELEYKREEYYIHVDGALFGLMLPFVKGELSRVTPNLSFKLPIDSISVSGHKFVGAPVPCGVVITRKAHIFKVSKDVEYLNSKDATIMGSRNGHAALYLWYAIQKKGLKGFAEDTTDCVRKAKILKQMLEDAGVPLTFLNDLSTTVVFERPQEMAFVRKWQLACQGDIGHVVVMPSSSVETLTQFVEEFKASRTKMASLGIRRDAGSN